MAYAYTVDERYVNGSTSYLVGTWDAPGSINNAYGLAESDVGFGALVGLDSDVLGFGTLEPGVYRVIADDLTWDPYTSDIASIASFALLGAGGEVVQTSNVPGDYIEFTVGAAASYSVAIYGYGGSIAQYGVVYAWVMPASVTSDISAVLAEPQDNLILTGDADIDGAGNDRDNEIIGNLGNNALGGLGGDDTLFGGAGADGLLGGNGGDILDGGAGADLMAGESGDDVYGVDNVGDVVIEEVGAGVDGVLASITYVLPAWVEVLRLAPAAGSIGGGGNEIANLIEGNDGANLLMGFGGDDTLRGGAGSDWLDGGSGSDDMEGGAGDDTYVRDRIGDDVLGEATAGGYDHVYSSVFYFFEAGVEELTLTGSLNSNGWGDGYDNRMTGNAGSNTLSGEGGDDILVGGGGNDSVSGDGDDDVVVGGDGNDSVRGDLGNDTVMGGIGNDYVSGGAGADTVAGGAGEDRLYADSGNDTLSGGRGEDLLSGGSGRDVFVFAAAGEAGRGAACDTVIFNRGFDRIDLGAIDAIESRAGNQAFRFIGERDFGAAGQLRCENGRVQADTDGDGRAEFEIDLGNFLGSLTGADFVL